MATNEIRVIKANRIPTVLSRADFEKVTGEADFPAALGKAVVSSQLLYHCNTTLLYQVRGVHIYLNIAWGFEAGRNQGDRHLARFRGTRSTVEVRQGEEEHFRPEVYVEPRDGADLGGLHEAVARRLEALASRYPGVRCEQAAGRVRLEVPDRLRVGHEAHFGEVMRRFLGYLDDPASLPAWEKANMLAKYHVTTHGVQMARAVG
jgi:hypothetical protein